MDVNNDKEHGGAIHVNITQKPASVNIPHNMFNAIKSMIMIGSGVFLLVIAKSNIDTLRDSYKNKKRYPITFFLQLQDITGKYYSGLFIIWQYIVPWS